MTTWDARANELFLKAREISSPEERRAFLDRECGGDAELRAGVESLLRAGTLAGDFLEAPALAHLTPSPAPHPSDRPGAVVGPYKLLEQIGEGGFGVVFMAEQTEPVRRRVALKVLKAGMDTRQVVARFEAERQALAIMDHPNIARILDGGETPAGLPYFVMELVRGVRITDFCDQNRLGVRQRLSLFVDVCQAVQHAHQKGIIHRDLKPSNVLVTMHDDRPVVKVIDFGIAKAVGQALTDKTLFTNFAQMIGTPLYMSPEQAGMSGLDVDTRSDIYSLGVLLYELLTGTTPFDRERFGRVGYDEIRRIIREEEPARPSTRMSTLGQAATTASANRGGDPARLSRLFRGELDWVAMKALEKDRNRRYETASAFAADVQRYLRDEPVLACPPSVGYRLGKFLRRNRRPVLAAGVVVVLLVAGVVGTTTGLFRALAAEERAVKERDEKEEAWRQTRQALDTMTDEMLEDLLGRQAQLTDQHRAFLKKVLEYHAAFAAAKADDPDGRRARAAGYFRVGLIRHKLGDVKEAEAAYRDAAAIRKQLADDFPDRPEYLSELSGAYTNLGSLLRDTGRTEQAGSAYLEALAIDKQLTAAFPERPEYRRDLMLTHYNLGILYQKTGRPKDAESSLREAVTIGRQLATEYPEKAALRSSHANNLIVLSALLSGTGGLEEAERLLRDALAIRKQLAADFPNVLDHRLDLSLAHNNLGSLLSKLGRADDAEAAHRASLAVLKQLAAAYPNRPDFRQHLAGTNYNLGVMLHTSDRSEKAEVAWRDALALYKQLVADFPEVPDYQRGLADTLNALATLLRATGRAEEAEKAHRDALAMIQRQVADFPEQPAFRASLALSYNNLGFMLFKTLGRPDDAGASYRDAAAVWKQLVQEFPNRPRYREGLAQTYYNLGLLYGDTRRPREAANAYRDSLAIHQRLAADYPTVPDYERARSVTFNQLVRLVRSLHSTAGPLDEREAAAREAVAVCTQLSADLPNSTDVRHELGKSHFKLGNVLRDSRRPREAVPEYEKAAALQRQLAADSPGEPAHHYNLSHTLTNLGNVLDRLKQPKEAEAAHREALTLLQKLVTEFPENTEYLRDLGTVHGNLGTHLRQNNRWAEAEKVYHEAVALLKPLADAFPDNHEYQNDLASTLGNLGFVCHHNGEYARAVTFIEQARPYSQAAMKADPRNAAYRLVCHNGLRTLAASVLALNDHAGIARAADEFARLAYDPVNDTYLAVRMLCQCAKLVGDDRKLTDAARGELAEGYTTRALAHLKLAVARGYKDAANLKRDPVIAPLRGRDDFRNLLAELEAGAKM
jgi:serine/threonine protein kinase/tetratricopeptide (TPR) repeat protein